MLGVGITFDRLLCVFLDVQFLSSFYGCDVSIKFSKQFRPHLVEVGKPGTCIQASLYAPFFFFFVIVVAWYS